MSPAEWTEVRTAFAELMEVPPAQRQGRLAQLPPAVRQEVASLLSAHDAADGFIERPATELPATGAHLGPYRLLEKLGEGGMGVVYRAARDDGEFHRQVAIKIAGAHLFAPEAERRFRHERQILAQLEHPHIVRMLDGGVEAGRRYLVMEYVEGRPITEHCAGLPLAQRLDLFRQVCAAVHYAHQSLVIHRDLKPANILVTAAGQAKVLDFGIAKLMDDTDAAATLYQPMSLRCASPEQARGERLTAATDIYSLGLLLYELLSGRHPHEPSAGETRQALVTRIVQSDVPAPGAGPDLDAVVLKALERDPAHRYASAAELGEDVRRYLAGDAVLARRPTNWQRLIRWAGRHRLEASLAVALLFALLAGTFAVAWQARVARQQRELAERRFDEARRLIRTVVQDVQPRLAAINGTLQTRRLLLEAATGYFERLSPEMGENPSLAAETIVAYQLLARATGSMNTANLGDATAGAALRKKGVALAETQLARYPDHPELLRAAVRILGDEPALAPRQRAVALAEKLTTLRPQDRTARDGLAFALFQLSLLDLPRRQDHLLRARGLWTQALQQQPGSLDLLRNIALTNKNLASVVPVPERVDYALRALELDQQVLKLRPASPQALLDVAIDLSMVSSGYGDRGDRAKALDYMKQSVAVREQVVAANPDDARAGDRLTYAVLQVGELASGAEAAAARRRGLTLARQLSARNAVSGQTQAWAIRTVLVTAAGCEWKRDFATWVKQVSGSERENVYSPQEAARWLAACGLTP